MSHLKFSLSTYTIIFLISFVDIVHDWEGMGGLNTHILFEIIVGLIAFGAFILMIYWNMDQNKKYRQLKSSFSTTVTQLNESQLQAQKLMGEFSKIIQTQFDNWKLTNSEKEVGLLLLKGFSLDEIAAVRETKAKTVRQQASNLYKKAGVSGRHDLVAYFFEDLLIS